MCCIASGFLRQTSLGNINILTIQSSPSGVLFNHKVNCVAGFGFVCFQEAYRHEHRKQYFSFYYLLGDICNSHWKSGLE